MRTGASAPSPLKQRAGWVRLREALAREQRPRIWRPRALVLTGVALVGGLAALAAVGRGGGVSFSASTPLTYATMKSQGNAVSRGGEPGGPQWRFSDGTDIVVKSASRARVVSVQGRGARIAVDDGELTAEVVPHPQGRWRFDAGPFSVFVEGTSFSLRWTAADERLHLRMYTGVVTVKGPLGSESIRVRGGETLTVHLPERQISLEGTVHAPAEVPESSKPPESAEPGGLGEPGEAVGPRGVPAKVGVTGAPPVGLVPAPAHPVRRRLSDAPSAGARSTWRELVAAGRSIEVVSEAERRGVADLMARGGREELAALADAARYSRRNDLARRTLHALRDRFPSSESAHDAAFFLGRLEEAENPKSARSLEWYRRYRAEAPRGLYLGDALGREMLSMERLYGRAAARATARQYLARFPGGHLAAQATEIAGAAR